MKNTQKQKQGITILNTNPKLKMGRVGRACDRVERRGNTQLGHADMLPLFSVNSRFFAPV